MILRGLQIENWRCIRSLTLEQLPLGIVVLHGPNRTGKTSLVKALRCCLFDADHNSTKEEISASIPRGGGTPKVVVEFFTAGCDYRITKVFSTRKDGLARLDKKIGGSWQVEEDSPKEAARKVRELLGSDKSTGGLNQLLWLTQGEVQLPQPDRFDPSLEKRLVGVLGSLLTGPDLAFFQELENRCKKWFTDKQGRPRKDSPVSLWEQRYQERLQARNQVREKLRQWEQALQQLQSCEDSLPELRRAVRLAEEELQQLEREREQGRERLRRYQEAEQAVQRARQDVQLAETSLRKFQDARQRLDDRERDLAQAALQVEVALPEKDRLAQEHAQRQHEWQAARLAEETHLRKREQIDDLRKLHSLAQRTARLEEVLQEVHRLALEITDLEVQMHKLAAPDEATLKDLRDNRRRAEALRAQLQAAAFTLSIQLAQPGQVTLALDNQAGQTIALPAGEKRPWQLHQQAVLTIPEVGTIELARSQNNLDLERAARELAELERGFRDVVRTWDENPQDETCLDRLSERRLQRKTWEQRLQRARQELRAQAPEGRGALESERAQLEQQRRVLLERRPDLAGSSLAAAEGEALVQDFEAQAEQLRTNRLQREAAEAQARKDWQKADERVQKAKEHLAAASAAVQVCREELQRLGNVAALESALEKAHRAQKQAEEALAANRLSDSERTVEQRWTAAKNALEQRRQRLREREDQLNQLRGFLQGNEGLHLQEADAEARLQEAEQALQRERLEANAHRRLRELFEECRANQVQRVMGPIASRVLDWARHIGIDDYHEVRFGDQFLPEGLVLPNGAVQTLVTLEEESYGTGEQLALLVRLALGGVLAQDEPVTALLDDPLAHADPAKHRRLLEVLQIAAAGNPAWNPPAGPVQIIILTCHPDRFDYLPGAQHIDLARKIVR